MSLVMGWRSARKRAGFLACLVLASSAAAALPPSDEASLRNLLDEFLARAGDVSMHETFWADDLVYTSSGGTRMDKQTILDSIRDAPPPGEAAAGPVYSATDVDVRVYGDTAVVAFRLVASGPAAEERSEYFNTGTFVRREDTWEAVAWQATRIPAGSADSGD